MSLNKSKTKSYIRPAAARNYLSYGRVVGGPEGWPNVREEEAVVPPLLKLRPMEYNWYAETDSVQNGASSVICSGNALVIGGTGGAGNRLGILKNDAEVGASVTVVTSGDFDFQVDMDGIAGTTALAASSTSGLLGKTAYYIAELGKISDQDPSPATNATGFPVGVFLEDEVSLTRPNRKPGTHFVRVRLLAEYQMSNTAISAVSNAGASTFSESIYAIVPTPTVWSDDFLTVKFEVNTATNNPNNSIEPSDVVWTIAGSTYTGFVASHTFSAGAGQSVSVTVKGTTTKNYEIDISASVAPTGFVAV